jgi:predicted small lipoprotein YifL
MPHLPSGPCAPAAPAARPAPRALAALAALATLTACAGRGPLALAADSRAATPATVLTCVAEVAVEAGLPVIEQHPEAETPELRAQSAAALATSGADARPTPAFDVLVVHVGKVGSGLRARAQTFHPPAASPRAENGTLWQSATPSPRVARARDAVLDRCSALGR